MAAPGLSARPPCQRPSRLPLHRCRPSRDKSSPVSPAASSSSHTSLFSDDRLDSGSRPPACKSSQVALNRMSVHGRQGVADDVPRRRQPQLRRRDATGVVDGSPASATEHGHHGDVGVVSELRSAVRPANNPSCGMRMSALRCAGRQQQHHQQQPSPQSPPSSIKSLSTSSTRLAAAGVQLRRVAKTRDTAVSSHYASTSSIDSTCSQHHLQHRAPVASRRQAAPPASSCAADDSCDGAHRQHGRSSRDSSASHRSRKMSRCVVSSESDEVFSCRSDRVGPPVFRHVPTAGQHTNNSQRRTNAYRSTFGVRSSTDSVDCSGRQQRSAAVIVEPRRRYYHLWRRSESEVGDLSMSDSTSTMTSIDSSSSAGTLTDDADESADESTTTAARHRRRRDRDHRDTSALSSARPASSHLSPPLYRSSVSSAHGIHTKPLSGCAGHASSSSELLSPPSMRVSRRPTEHWDIQRIGDFGMTPRAPAAAVSKHTTRSPPLPSQNCALQRDVANRPRSRPTLHLSASDEPATGPRSNISPSPRRLSSESAIPVAKSASRHVAYSSSIGAVVRREQQMVLANSSSVQLNPTGAKSPNSQPHFQAQTRQNTSVEKAARISNAKSSISRFSVNQTSKVVDEKHVTSHLPLQRVSGTASTRAASQLLSSSHDCARQSGNDTRLQTHLTDKDSANNAANNRKLVDKAVGNTTAGAMTSQGSVKSIRTAVKQISSSQSESVHNMDSSHPVKTARHIPAPSTRSTKTQTTSPVVTRPVDSVRGNGQTEVTKRPPPPPSKLRRPSSVCGVTSAADRGRVSVTGQSRPASTDFSAVSSAHQRPVNVRRKKSESCTNVTNLSAMTEEAPTTRKPAKGVLNKNDQLTKSCDCITPRSNHPEIQNLDMICSQRQGSTTSLVDVQPRRLVKPYSVINRCSTFGRKMTAPKENSSTTIGCTANSKTEHGTTTDSRHALALQACRASELSDLPEVDEIECDHQMSTVDRLSADEKNRVSDCGRQEATEERTEAVTSPPIYPDVQQKPVTQSFNYRTEYSTFLSVVPPQAGDRLTGEIVAETNDSSLPHPDSVSATMVQDKSDAANSCSFQTRFRGNCNAQALYEIEDFRPTGYVESANNSRILAARPATLSAKVLVVEDAAAAADAAVDNYVVAYESDNIVVLDREPVIDCLTPDADVVSTELRRLLTVPAVTTSVEGGMLRTLPLSESGYDTWKSSQGSVAVVAACVGNTYIVMPPDFSAEQQRHLEDGTLRTSEPLKIFDAQSAEPSLEKKVYGGAAERRETCQREGDDSSVLVGDGDGEPTESVSGAAAAVDAKDDDGHSESPSRDDDRGRAADSSVEDSACTVAQMFASICSEQVASGASSCGALRVADSAVSRGAAASLASPPDSAASGHSDICFSSQTIPSDDSDLWSTCRASPPNAAHLESFDEEADKTPSLLSGMGHFRHHVDVEISGAFDNAADVERVETSFSPAVILITESTKDYDTGKDCAADVKQLDQHRAVSSEICLQLNPPGESSDSAGLLSSASVTDAIADSMLLDPYETICDDLLESIEATILDLEASHPSSSTYQATEDLSNQLRAKSSGRSDELMPVNDQVTAVAVGGSGVDRQPSPSCASTLNSSSPSTAMTGRLPVMTLRRARTNFSVVCAQSVVSGAWQSSAHDASVEVKATAQKTASGSVDLHGRPVGCRRALAVLASRLDDHSRRRLAETNVDQRLTFQSPAVKYAPDVPDASPAVSLSAKVRPVASSSTVTGDSDVTVAWNDLQSTQSSSSVYDEVTPVSAVSQLPISISTSDHRSASKKPSTFRKLFSSKLTNAVRRTQTKYD